jgi:ATP-dependent DNA helicase RecG
VTELAEIHPQTPLTEATSKRLNKKQLSGLEALGLFTVGDLITHYPRRYEDRTRFEMMPTGASEVPVCLKMEVIDCSLRRVGGKRTIFEAVVDRGESAGGGLGGTLVLRWFNLPFMNKVLAVGHELVVYGKTKQSGRRLVMDHPDIEIIDPDDPEAQRVHLDRITPVYGLASGINQRTLRAMAFEILERITDDALPDLLIPAPDWAKALNLWRGRALRQIHFPDNEVLLAEARRYLALEEFVALQINVLQRRAEYDARGGISRTSEGFLLKDLLDSLPFELTGAQRRCVEEIRADLASPRPMNRLLQGDVGSGKTLVALSGMLLAVEAGYQAALMAPTQILAEQHYIGIHRLLEPLDIRVSLRTGAKHEDGFLPLMAGDGAPQIIIGTHALIHDKVEFENLGFVVVDEQHKFGVTQRGKLIEQGNAPDVLVMTATPIPRTLTLSIYGDLDVSMIDELPAGRGKIVTGIRGIDKTEKAAAFIRDQLEENRQAYIVYPLIEESEKLKSLAATVEFDKWVKRFEHFECGLIHGRMNPLEKEQVMKDFRDARLDVLIATTVIEVGVDVPNANVMLIYNAERFGLAQLHQLRGRIGRGAHKSYCVLMVDPKNGEAMQKLKVMEETIDGFKIADADLKMRGPGEVLGTAQSGLPDLKLGDLVTDTELVKEARELAAEILRSDPQLQRPNHRELAQRFAGGGKAAGQLS